MDVPVARATSYIAAAALVASGVRAHQPASQSARTLINDSHRVSGWCEWCGPQEIRKMFRICDKRHCVCSGLRICIIKIVSALALSSETSQKNSRARTNSGNLYVGGLSVGESYRWTERMFYVDETFHSSPLRARRYLHGDHM